MYYIGITAPKANRFIYSVVKTQKIRFAQGAERIFFVDRRDSKFMPAGVNLRRVTTSSRTALVRDGFFYSKSHLSPVPSLLLSKMQTFHWFAFWFFFQCLKTVGHPAFLSILRKAGCPFLMFNIFLSGAAMRHAFLNVFQFDSNMPVMRRFVGPAVTRKPRFGRRGPIRNAAPIHRWVLRYFIISFYSQTAFRVPR